MIQSITKSVSISLKIYKNFKIIPNRYPNQNFIKLKASILKNYTFKMKFKFLKN